MDVPTVFREGQEYCRTAYGADILNITNEDERLFWSFHLMRYSNLSSDVWLDNKMFMNLAGITLKQNECLALRSRYSTAPGGGKVGEVFIRQCTDEASTVCEIRANKKLSSKVEPKDFNPNEEFVANNKLKYSNGTDSDLFSGVYYLVTSKFKDTPFSNGILGNVSFF